MRRTPDCSPMLVGNIKANPMRLGRPSSRLKSTASRNALAPPVPFLKWAGGKRQLLSEILPRLPRRFGRYFEPFVGGGAVFFGLRPRRAVLSDANGELMAAYVALRDHVEEVIEALQQHKATKEHFYGVRALNPSELSPVEAAARTIFLNRTCFNGLYRVNSRGIFNVPFGRRDNPGICHADNLRSVAAALQEVELIADCVFRVTTRCKRGDLVYLDPPYDRVSPTAFTAYDRYPFHTEEQERLAERFAALAKRGVHVMLSNADTPLINKLYRGFPTHRVRANRLINSKGDARGPVNELLVSSFG